MNAEKPCRKYGRQFRPLFLRMPLSVASTLAKSSTRSVKRRAGNEPDALDTILRPEGSLQGSTFCLVESYMFLFLHATMLICISSRILEGDNSKARDPQEVIARDFAKRARMDEICQRVATSNNIVCIHSRNQGMWR